MFGRFKYYNSSKLSKRFFTFLLYKKKFNSIFESFIFFNNKIVLFSSLFQKNEYYIISDKNNFYLKYNYFLSYSTLVDIITYDSSNFTYLINKKNSIFIKIYNYNNDSYLNFFTNNFSMSNLYGNFNWHVRECLEFFDFKIKFNFFFDNRNLLTNYSNREFFLNKNSPVSGYYDYKVKNNNFKFFNKKQTIL